MPPLILALGPDSTRYAAALWVLLALFVLRVLGQVLVVLSHPRWLPPMKEWYSGLLPYPALLPVQIVFIWVMTWIALDFTTGTGTFAQPRPLLGAALVWFSYVYALGMVVRFVIWLQRPPERRRAWIPIIFHIVLAAFVWVWGSWNVMSSRGSEATEGSRYHIPSKGWTGATVSTDETTEIPRLRLGMTIAGKNVITRERSDRGISVL